MLDIAIPTILFLACWLACGFLWCILRALVNAPYSYDRDWDYTEVDDDEVLGAAILGPVTFLIVAWYLASHRLWPWLRTNARLAWRGARRFWA